MNLPEESAYSFVVRVWLEEPADESHGATWRGYITEVLGEGRLHHIDHLQEITQFIAAYLRRLGVDVFDDGSRTGQSSTPDKG